MEEEDIAARLESGVVLEEEDPLSENYGPVTLWLRNRPAGRLMPIHRLGVELEGERVIVRGILRKRLVDKEKKEEVILVLSEKGKSVQCLVTVEPGVVSPRMVQYATDLKCSSLMDIVGIVSVPPALPIQGTTQQVVVRVLKFYCIRAS